MILDAFKFTNNYSMFLEKKSNIHIRLRSTVIMKMRLISIYSFDNLYFESDIEVVE